MNSLVWKQKGAPLDPVTYWELSVLYLLGKLLALSCLHHLDAEIYRCGWLVEEWAGFCLGDHVEDH